MNSKALIFVAGMAAGIASGAVLWYSKEAPAAPPVTEDAVGRAVPAPAAKPAESGDSDDELTRARQQIAQLRQENEQLREWADQAYAQIEAQGDRRERFREAFAGRRERMQEARNAREELTIAQAQQYFGLSDAQVAQLQQKAQQRRSMEDQGLALWERVQSGELTSDQAREQWQALRRQMGDPLDDLKTVLTTDQQAQYEPYVAQQEHERREAQAYGQLSQLGRVMTLSEQQKDALFQTFYETASPVTDQDGPGSSPMPREQRQAAERQQLESILTPEQLKLYDAQAFRGPGGFGGRPPGR